MWSNIIAAVDEKDKEKKKYGDGCIPLNG